MLVPSRITQSKYFCIEIFESNPEEAIFLIKVSDFHTDFE